MGQCLLVDTSILHLGGVLALEESGPGRVEPVLVEDLCLLASLLVGLLADLLVFVDNVVDLPLGDDALLDQLLRVKV